MSQNELIRQLADALEANRKLQDRCDHLLLQAQCQAQEMRTHKATVHEMYQVLTGASGEPGNWHGAEPARKVMAALQAERTAHQQTMRALEMACSESAKIVPVVVELWLQRARNEAKS